MLKKLIYLAFIINLLFSISYAEDKSTYIINDFKNLVSDLNQYEQLKNEEKIDYPVLLSNKEEVTEEILKLQYYRGDNEILEVVVLDDESAFFSIIKHNDKPIFIINHFKHSSKTTFDSSPDKPDNIQVTLLDENGDDIIDKLLIFSSYEFEFVEGFKFKSKRLTPISDEEYFDNIIYSHLGKNVNQGITNLIKNATQNKHNQSMDLMYVASQSEQELGKRD